MEIYIYIYKSHRNIGWKAHSPSYGHHKKAVIFLLMEFAEVRSMAGSAGCAENMAISYKVKRILGYLFVGFHKWGYPIAGWFIREHPSING